MGKDSRFTFVFQPLSPIDENEETHRRDFPFSGELLKRRYPIRAMRYWWLDWAVRAELDRLGRQATIVDVGCDRGIIKRFIRPSENARWIGLDIDINREGIEFAKYDELVQCDFDEGLPLPDASVDIAICSHVLEHLLRPEFAIQEIARIVRPGGLLLVGVPIAPKFIAKRREKTFAEELKAGTRHLGQHIHVFWGKRLRQMAESNGFAVDLSTGTAIIRKKGSFLEDHAAWVRLNQFAAAMFPPIGQELCMKLRKAA